MADIHRATQDYLRRVCNCYNSSTNKRLYRFVVFDHRLDHQTFFRNSYIPEGERRAGPSVG